jgi:alkylhydroperoxidase family enzyme
VIGRALSDAERAALGLAFAAGQVPNAATDAHFEALRAHYDEREIVEIVAVISVFGFLNRWNDTMATTLESAPMHFAADQLASQGWVAGKHE